LRLAPEGNQPEKSRVTEKLNGKPDGELMN